MRRLGFLSISVWVILSVAALTRVAFAVDQARRIPPEVLRVVPFSNEAGSIAYALSTGHGFSAPFRTETGPTAWLAPAYPLLLAGIFKIFGPFTLNSFYLAVAWNIIVSALATLPLYFAGKRLGGVPVACLAAWLWAINPNAIVIPFEWIWDTCSSALLGASLLWATMALRHSHRFGPWFAYGLLCGLALLTNPAFASLLPFLFVWLALQARKDKPAPFLRHAVLAAAVTVFCCLPWTIRNYAVFRRLIPLRSNFSFELWLGNNEVFDAQSRSIIGSRVTIYGETRRYSQLGEMAFMDEKWHKATAFMAAHAALELRLTRDRIVAMWIGTAHPVRDFRASDSLLGRSSLFANLAVTLGTVLGTVMLFRRRNPLTMPVVAFATVFPCIYYITHASLRYRHPADPALLLLTAAGAVAAAQWFARQEMCESSP